MQLSKLEYKVYKKLKENNIQVFKIKDVCLLLQMNKIKVYNIIKSLKKKGAIKSQRKGFIALKETNEFIIAAAINNPSYISLWSALNYYGFSDQLPKKIFVITAKKSEEINSFKYVKISKKRFFGYVKSGELTISDPEKTIIDSLLFPKYSGGIKEIMLSIKNNINKINIKKLIGYAFKVESKAVLRRLGFILDNIHYKGKGLKEIKKNIGNGYELLDPALKRKNNLNKKWLLDVNY